MGKTLSKTIEPPCENVVWSSSDETIASVSANGVVTGIAVGSCVVYAEDSDGNITEYPVDVKKVCYLTFDDGPNERTGLLLDKLTKNGITATFFVGNKTQYYDKFAAIHEQGSAIGLHAYTHEYQVCYKDMYSYIKGIEQLSDIIYQHTGVRSKIVRFPGGSNNTVSNALVMNRTIQGIKDLGYEYYDWTGSAGDTSIKNPASTDRTVENISKYCKDDVEIILLHEKACNIAAIDRIVPILTKRGYIFETLDNCNFVCHATSSRIKTVKADSVKLDKSELSIYQGNNSKLKASLTPFSSTEFIRFCSSDESVAKVGIDGTVIGISKGTAVITATSSSGKTAECTVSVKMPIKEITAEKSEYYVNVGTSEQISLNIVPSENDDFLSWTSSNRRIATVDQNGNVNALANGKVTITLKSDSGIIKTFSVYSITPAESIDIKGAADLYISSSRRLSAVLSKKSNDPVTWSSDAPEIVSVSSNGTIKALAQGTAVITAETYSGKTASVTITAKTKASKLSLSSTSQTVLIGETFELDFDITKPDECNDTIKWSASKNCELSISGDKKHAVITGVKKGSGYVCVSTGSGKKISCKVNVIVPSELTVMNKSSANVYLGKKILLKAINKTKGSNDFVKSWISSDESIAVVSAQGVVTAKSIGSVTITAVMFGGEKTESVVTVRSKAKEIILDNTQVTANIGDEITLKADITSPTECNDTLKWTVSSCYIEIVDQNEKELTVRTLRKGTFTITIKTGSGKAAKCKIIVK